MTEVLEFVGEPFDAVAWTTPPPEPGPAALLEPASPRPHEVALRAVPAPAQGAPPAASTLAELRTALVSAHSGALRAQAALQRRLLRLPGGYATSGVLVRVSDEAAFKPLARSAVTRLGTTELRRLAVGDIAGVFGARYDQEDCNPDVRLAAGAELALAEVTALQLRGGAGSRGRVLARRVPGADPVDAAVQAAQVFALYTGLHLCLADARFVRVDPQVTRIEQSAQADGDDVVEVEVEWIDLVPRPGLRVRARCGGTLMTDVALALHERPGVPVGPERGGVPARWLGRTSSLGEHVLLSEFQLAHLARGDQGIALGPEFAHYSGIKATRIPTGGLLLVDRVVALQGERGKLDSATYQTEYDSPADSWYYADTANASMPNCVYMETSLQSALLIGYHLGATLSRPDETQSLRNLGGTATVLREVDLRDTTIRQDSALLGTTDMPGSTLQSFTYTLTADGEPFYAGETLFGYFSEQALANQTGLDAGRSVPTWLEQNPGPEVRTIDVAARRAAPAAPLCSRDHLSLLDELTVVDGGGQYGKGYLHAERTIDPQDWFFARHFHLDPVIPGSLGVETVIQAMQEWLLDSGLAEGMRDPGFVLPVGVPFTWKYRGQFLPTDGSSTLEVHVKEVQRKSGRLRLTADASMWKPGLRIYELTDIAIELRENGAAPW
ncbi:beta-hydroxydecanoyl-ACP dehydratase [Streptomyces sp. NPDC050997]|uniref:beta-hydroxydecanoyl-ACP dehydratase n=1 Tax=Streptomyces sp. NPDC050997 TaxID=3155519 RepID=UPI003426610B